MAVDARFIETLTELLAPLGRIRTRAMFGGAAIYCDGQVFGLIDGETLYLKADATTRGDFLAEGCGPFVYESSGAPITLASYHRLPDRLLDEPDEMLEWVRRALRVARAAARGTTPKRSASKPTKPNRGQRAKPKSTK